MSNQQTIHAQGSMRTAFWCWTTKMALQWGIVCGPFVFVFSHICPDIIPLLVIKLTGYSLLLATVATLVLMRGKLKANEQGLYYDNNVIFKHTFIPWQQMEFGTPFPLTLEKPIIIVKRGTRDHIKIWPSIHNYDQLKTYFAAHKIDLGERRFTTTATASDFRPLDDVISEALGPR